MNESKETKSVYIRPSLWDEAKRQAGDANLSLIVAELLQLWIDGKVTVAIEPVSNRLRREHFSEKYID